MKRYKLFIEFKGTHFSGWQIQPNARTVEEEIEQALSKILQQPVDIIGQGRTDSGVHAEKQIAHVDLPLDNSVDDLLYALRGVLPKAITVWDMQQVSTAFHARFDATSRQYRYQIITRPSPLLRDLSFFEAQPLDFDLMTKCACLIQGKNDFENFSKANKDQKHAICTIEVSTWEQQDYVWIYRIKANRFVHNMVRRLVGTMLEVGKGELTFQQFQELLNNPESSFISTGITGRGLILEDVLYGS